MMPRTLAGATALLFAAAAPAALAADGAAVYSANCAKCHGDTGHADTAVGKALKVPALAGDANITGATQADLVKKIKENPKHAAFSGKLSAEELDAVAARVKELATGK